MYRIEDYLPIESYEEGIDAFHGVCGMILFEFARRDSTTREAIIRNFVARTDTMVRAVLRLWQMNDFQDCWVLHRCITERLFLISELALRNEFDSFQEWSFYEQYKAQNRARSDPDVTYSKDDPLFNPTPEQREMAKRLSSDPPKWARPNAQKVARRMKMPFLYRFAYDYSSTHVHPMADDGHQDFYTITGLEPAPDFPDQRAVLSNSVLVGTLTIQEGLNASRLRWRSEIYDVLAGIRCFMGTGSTEYRGKLLKLMELATASEPLSEVHQDPSLK